MFKRIAHWGCRYHWLVLFGLLLFWLVVGYIDIHTTFSKQMYLNLYPLTKQTKISQTFRADYPGLYRIDVYFKRQNPVGKGGIIFRLKDSCGATDLQTLFVPAADIVDDTFYPFVFAPIIDSVNRQFCMVLEPQDLDKTFVGIYASTGDAYVAGSADYHLAPIREADRVDIIQNSAVISSPFLVWLPMIVKGKVNPAAIKTDIDFQLYYRGAVVPTLQALLTHLVWQKPGIFGKVWFYVILGAIYLLGLSVLWLTVLKISQKDS